jgi:FAD/FMN-containing dehydrogenase
MFSIILYIISAASIFPVSRAAHPRAFVYRPAGGGALPVATADTLARLSAARSFRAVGYCTPSQPCWPTNAEWSLLNATVNGRLMAILPEGSPCIDPSSAACTEVQNDWTDPVWRAAQPGAMQRPFWEANRNTGANCYTLGEVCAQGDVPPVGVAAESAADVAAAIAFATLHNIHVVIKSTGHDIQGRSTAPDSLLIWTAHMRNITIHDSYMACTGDTPIAAVSVAPGNSYGELYALLDPSKILVGGSARTVSAAGGHVLGGGHSFISPHFGLAVDNVLSAEVVLANASIVRASACENSDLFWALRGGGGGSFGILTEITHKLHDTPPAVSGVFFEVALLQGLTSVSLWLDGALALTPALLNASSNAGGGLFGGYHNVFPVDSSPGVFVWESIWNFNSTTDNMRTSLAGFRALVASQPAHFYLVNESYASFASFEQWHSSFDPPATGDRTGTDSTIGCRFIPKSYALDPALRANATYALTAVLQYLPSLLGHLVAGGAVAAFDRDSKQTSVTPAWRDAVWHECIGGGWDSSANITVRDSIITGVSQLTGYWRDFIPDSGAYFNEADLLEPNWQESFFGLNNYARLQAIKKTVDPNGIFNCWHCVELPPT